MNNLTPNLKLALGPDADVNANWEKLDALIGLLSGPGTILPGDTEVQGNLTVDGSSNLIGDVFARSGLSVLGLTDLQTTITHGLLTAAALTVSPGGAVVLPPQSVVGAALAKNAAVQGAWVSAATGQQAALTATPTVLNSVTPTGEDSGRWELVFAQATFAVSLPNAGASGGTTWVLRRGSVDQQSRAFTWVTVAPVNLNMDHPLTMVRLAQVQPADVGTAWALAASYSGTPAGASVTPMFTQLHVIEFT